MDGTVANQNDWNVLDTNDLAENDFFVFIQNSKVISDGDIAYVESTIHKTNIPIADPNQRETVIIDYREKKIYFLENKTANNLVKNKTELVSLNQTANAEESIYRIDSLSVRILLAKEMPQELKSNLIQRRVKWGVQTIDNNYHKDRLLSFEKCEDCVDLKILLKVAKQLCVLQEEVVDLLTLL